MDFKKLKELDPSTSLMTDGRPAGYRIGLGRVADVIGPSAEWQVPSAEIGKRPSWFQKRNEVIQPYKR